MMLVRRGKSLSHNRVSTVSDLIRPSIAVPALCVCARSKCVRLYAYFEEDHRGSHHLFIVFERLGRSLYDYVKRNDHRGFSLDVVRDIGRQLLQAVACTMWM
jgi:hypothetical protein